MRANAVGTMAAGSRGAGKASVLFTGQWSNAEHEKGETTGEAVASTGTEVTLRKSAEISKLISTFMSKLMPRLIPRFIPTFIPRLI